MNNWNKTFLNIAQEFANHSHCARLHVGAVLVKDKRIISCGYNGVPSGMSHCDDHFEDFDMNSEHVKEMHHSFSKKYELHAEQNCIAYAAKAGVGIDKDCELYITTSPCQDCAKLIVAAGIKKVVFRDKYDRDTEGIEFLKATGVKVIHFGAENE